MTDLNELKKIAEDAEQRYKGQEPVSLFDEAFSPTLILKLLEELQDARETLAKAEIGFMAMANSTMDNGAPSAPELIRMCENKAIQIQQHLAKYKESSQ